MNEVFSSTSIEKQLSNRLPFWTVKQGELNRIIVFDSQSEKCAFINHVFSFAEQHHHHPTLWINHLKLALVYLPMTVMESQKKILFSQKKSITFLKINAMEWYMKNRWWIWSVTGVYLAYRILTSFYSKLLPFELKNYIITPPFFFKPKK